MSLPLFLEHKATLPVNEIFGPTIQGEGMEIGWPCFFLRLHNCPVKCPGCDTHYTWDGSEGAKSHQFDEVAKQLRLHFDEYPGAGLVVSGGEPLLYYKSANLARLITWVRDRTWVSLETSGFAGKEPLRSKSGDDAAKLVQFLQLFTSVHLSPKITPCLHGQFTDKELTCNVSLIMNSFRGEHQKRLALKLVARDAVDIEVIRDFDKQFSVTVAGFKLYVMPYGIEADEVAMSCRVLVEPLAKSGYLLSPRLHSLLWGPARRR